MPNHGRINPPEPNADDLRTCEQCGEDDYPEHMVNVGAEMFPIWLCAGGSCLKDYATDITAELQYERHRSSRLVRQVATGCGPKGHHDFGRWDIFADTSHPAGCLVFKSAPYTGQYRVIQIGDGE
jgi:hypothetical protein